MKLYFSRPLLLTLLTGLTPLLAASTTDTLSKGFLHPPATARPWVYWWWLDSNASRVGITRDLEALKRQGIAGALVFDAGAGHGTPVGPAFMSEPWRALFKYAVQEAHRIGISLSFNICSGWDCGGPWVTPERALKRLTWSELKVRGPASFSELLTKPPATDGFYRDIAVLAFPTSDSLQSASCLNLTDRLASSGELTWNVPAGDWLLLRFGQTLYGGGEGKTKLSSPGGQGYETDFLSAEALDHWQFLLQQGRFVADVCYFAGDMPCYVPARTQMKPSLPVGYDCDTVNTEVLLTRLTVVNGRLTLPDGMSYRLLVLPDRTSMMPEVLRKLAAFIETGATVLGPKPVRSPSLRRYPACDAEVQDLADKMWRGCDGTNVYENTYGGRTQKSGRGTFERQKPGSLLDQTLPRGHYQRRSFWR